MNLSLTTDYNKVISVVIVCHWCQPTWCLYLMTTTVMCSLLDGDPCSGHSLMWWSQDDGDGGWLMMMQLGNALILPYVFIVFIDACGWIPCHMMPWSHGSCSLMRLTWCTLMDMTLPWSHDDLVLISWWRWHDDVLPWFVDGDAMMMSCHDRWCRWHILPWYVDVPCWWWHDTFMCLMGCWWAYEPCDEVSYTFSFTYPCASPTYSCNPLQDPHTPILNPNTPSYTLPCILHYTFTLPIT